MVVFRRKGRVVLFMAATCCLLVAATGCNLHRAGHGYVLRGSWSLECGDTGSLATSGSAGPCETCSFAEETKPEVLPWRTRLKTQIGERLFHREEGAIQKCSGEDAIATPGRPSQSAPLATPPDPPEKRIVTRESFLSAKTSDLQVPKAAPSKPESTRPDLVME